MNPLVTGGGGAPINRITFKNSPEYRDWYTHTRALNTNNFTYLQELLTFAHKLIGPDIPAFIEENYKKGVFGPLVLDFMFDTLTFAQGGQRRMELTVAERLLDETIPPSQIDKRYYDATLKDYQQGPVLDILAKQSHSIYLSWTRNKNGVNDLAKTLAILFT